MTVIPALPGASTIPLYRGNPAVISFELVASLAGRTFLFRSGTTLSGAGVINGTKVDVALTDAQTEDIDVQTFELVETTAGADTAVRSGILRGTRRVPEAVGGSTVLVTVAIPGPPGPASQQRSWNGLAYAPLGGRTFLGPFDPAGTETVTTADVWIVTTDSVPPAAPTGLVGLALDTVARLSWAGSPEPDLAGYRAWRDGTQVYQGAGPGFDDPGRANGTAYSYEAAAYDESGNVSLRAGPVAVTPSAAPYVRQSVFAAAISSTPSAALPSAPLAGSVLAAVIGRDGNAGFGTANQPLWADLGIVQEGTNQRMTTYWRVAGGAEPAQQNFTISSTAAWHVCLMEIAQAGATPIGQYATAAAAPGPTSLALGTTTLFPDQLAIAAWRGAVNPTFLPPPSAGFAVLAGSTSPRFEVATKTLGAAGEVATAEDWTSAAASMVGSLLTVRSQ